MYVNYYYLCKIVTGLQFYNFNIFYQSSRLLLQINFLLLTNLTKDILSHFFFALYICFYVSQSLIDNHSGEVDLKGRGFDSCSGQILLFVEKKLLSCLREQVKLDPYRSSVNDQVFGREREISFASTQWNCRGLN